MNVCVSFFNGHVEMVSFHFELISHEYFIPVLLTGECIVEESDRHRGDRLGIPIFCENLRDIQFICETVKRNSQQWCTIDGGYCLPYSLPYQTLGSRHNISSKYMLGLCKVHIRP